MAGEWTENEKMLCVTAVVGAVVINLALGYFLYSADQTLADETHKLTGAQRPGNGGLNKQSPTCRRASRCWTCLKMEFDTQQAGCRPKKA